MKTKQKESQTNRNSVAKFAHKFNKYIVIPSKKSKQKHKSPKHSIKEVYEP